MNGFSVAANVSAPISLAVQLASSVQDLSKFWETVAEAPSEISDIRSQLQLLNNLLRSIQTDQTSRVPHSSALSDNIGHECLTLCTNHIAKLENLTARLDRGLRAHSVRRRWTCLTKSLRDGQINNYWMELERAKTILIVYQGWANGQRQNALHSTLSRILDARDLERSCMDRDSEMDISFAPTPLSTSSTMVTFERSTPSTSATCFDTTKEGEGLGHYCHAFIIKHVFEVFTTISFVLLSLGHTKLAWVIMGIVLPVVFKLLGTLHNATFT